ncbi:MAG: hypothetical protein P3W95_000715 [Tepidimonas taiwanensis]|nr:hypothetical protein [Tepidimonas taiwanensis]
MAKTATKAKQEQAVAAAGKPAAWIEVHGSDERLEAVAPKLVQAAMRAMGLVKRIDGLEEELKGLRAELAEGVGAGRSLVVPGVCRVSVAKTTSVGIKDAEKLRELLGERFGDLVSESVSYKPSEALVEMSADGDDPMAPAYRALLTVRSGTTVRITAEK